MQKHLKHPLSKRIWLIIFSALTCYTTYGQDPKQILLDSYQICKSIDQGYYEMAYRHKVMTDNDTSAYIFKCNFKKLEEKDLLSNVFHNIRYKNNLYHGASIYTGKEFISVENKDSTATTISKTKWPDVIRDYADNTTLYTPLTQRSVYPYPFGKNSKGRPITYKFVGTTYLQGKACWHVQVNRKPPRKPRGLISILREEHHFWINQSDLIPLQFSSTYDLFIDGHTMCQYDLYTLLDYQIGKPIPDTHFTLESIPKNYKIKDYSPSKPLPQLPIDTIAPSWIRTSLTNETVNLDSLRGHVVLIDFFYKSCLPCMKALPELEDLHKKYSPRGLKVIGMDPYDTPQDDLQPFLSARGITYTVVYGQKEDARAYRVSAYPTLFLIDKKGKIVLIEIGFGENSKSQIEAAILKHL